MQNKLFGKFIFKLLICLIYFSTISVNLIAMKGAKDWGKDVLEELAKDMKRGIEDAARQEERKIEDIEKEIEQLHMDYKAKAIDKEIYLTRLKMKEKEKAKLEESRTGWNKTGQDITGMYGKVAAEAAGNFFAYQNKQQNKEIDQENLILKEIAQQETKNKGDLQKMEKFIEKFFTGKNLSLIGGTTVATLGGIFLLYYTAKVGGNYAESLIGKPILIRETTRHDWKNSVKEFYNENILGIEKEQTDLGNAVFTPKMEEEIKFMTEDIKTSIENGLFLPNFLFYGLPGTGKTFVAKMIGKYVAESGVDFAFMSGADFAQFDEGEAIAKIHEVFAWAKQRPLVLFLDEAEAFLRDRRVLDNKERNKLNAYLADTGEKSKNICVIYASNYEDELDPAILSRIDKKVYFPAPQLDERYRMFKKYFDNYIVNYKDTVIRDNEEINISIEVPQDVNDDKYLMDIAKKIDGLVGRGIQQLVIDLQKKAFLRGKGTLTKEICENAITDKMTQHKHDMEISKMQRDRQLAQINNQSKK